MPVSFEVYRDGQRVHNFEPVAAYAVSAESVPWPAQLAVRDGLLTLSRSDDVPLGLSLLWECDAGKYHLETTRVAPRERPYNLNVELARFRLMKIMQKQEEWSLFDFPRAEKFTTRFREVQQIFTDALCRQEEPAEASKLADRALAEAINLSEEIAMFHCDLLLNRRRSSNAFVKHIFGCQVDVGVQNNRYREVLANSFDYAVLPLPWKIIQPQEGVFETQQVDTWAEALSKKRLPIIAGPLVNFTEEDLPDWMFIWENDFETVRELAYGHVQKLVQRYRKAVSLWNVVAGLSTNRAFTLTFEQMIEMTRLLVSQVKNILPSARTLVSISQPFGEYHATNPHSVTPPLLYAEMVSQAGIAFDGFALELELGVPQPGKFMRDLFQVSTLLDRLSTLSRPVFITAISVPGRATPDAGDRSEGRLDPTAAGQWHRPWDPQLQAEWMDAIYHLALSKPFVESVSWGNLADINQTVPGGGLLDDMLQPKPAYEKLVQLREKFAGWQGKK